MPTVARAQPQFQVQGLAPIQALQQSDSCFCGVLLIQFQQSNTMLIPQWSYLKEFKVKNAEFKKKQKGTV